MVTAHHLAKASPLISASMIEAIEFPHLIQKYSVTGVPKVILNEVHEFTGALPEQEFVNMVLQAGGTGI